MIAKRIEKKGAKSSYKKLVDYLLDKKNEGEKVLYSWETNTVNEVVFGDPDYLGAKNHDLAVREIEYNQELNTRAKSCKTYHLVFSFRSNENPDIKTIKEIESALCQAIGYEDHHRIAVIHNDTNNFHAHVAISKIHPVSRNCIEPYYDKKKLQKACKELEIKYGLEVEKGREQGGSQQKTNIDQNIPPRTSSTQKLEDMKSHSPLQSFTGWLKSNVRDDLSSLLAESPSWSEIHGLLAKNDVTIRPRGAGYVFSHRERKLFVKASSVDRQFSKNSIEVVAGPYQKPYDAHVIIEPARSFSIKTRNPGSANLWNVYQSERKNMSQLRKKAYAENREWRSEEVSRARLRYKDRRMDIRLDSVLNGDQKRSLYSQEKVKLLEAEEKIKKRAAKKREEIFQEMNFPGWIDWLKKRVLELEDNEALNILKSKGISVDKPINSLTPVNPLTEAKVMIWQSYECKILRSGQVCYELSGGKITDAGDQVFVSNGASEAAVKASLQLSVKKFGKHIDINGSKEFIEKALRLIREDKELGFIIVDKVNRRIEPKKKSRKAAIGVEKDEGRSSPELQ